jgi:purine-nucleoside phosphorylase
MSYPNLKNKHLYKSYFSAKDFIAYSKKSKDWIEFKNPKVVILIYSSNLLKYILETYETEHIESFGDFYLLKNMSVGILKIDGIGAPAAVTSLEEMIALGIDTFINLRTTGGLQNKSNIGDLVLCIKAIKG